MRAKIGKHVYDTNKSTWLAEAESTVESTAAPDYFQEALYRTRRGQFFLYGHGGPMTPYASRLQDGSIGAGEAIVPLTPAAAAAWCVRHDIDPEEEGFAHLLQ